jgi:hypothetical protein
MRTHGHACCGCACERLANHYHGVVATCLIACGGCAQERVEKAGGQVLYWNGHRVMGVLAMSRAIGDHGLRPYIIPEPEITVLQRVPDDDFLLLASDGLWDVMTNQVGGCWQGVWGAVCTAARLVD